MSDIHRAAIVLMSLPEDEAALVLSKLSAKEVEQVSIEIARTKRISPMEQDTTIREFANTSPAASTEGGSLDLAKNLVKKALGSDAGQALDNIRQQIEALPFGFLRTVDSQNVLTYLSDEHPQTIALVMSYLPANYAAEVLAGLSPDRQLAVVRRMATMGQTNPEIIREVERGLEGRMSNVVSQSLQSAGGVEPVAEMLNVTERSIERMILDQIAEEDPDLVEEIRRLMFVFEDVAKFSGKDIQVMLKHIETSQWALALKGASEELKDKVLGNMSQRAADMLREEMEFLGAVKVSAVEAEQQRIVDIVRSLEDAGEIEINANGEEEQLVQ
ncbi:flagellar motor switch protein FliG [Aeoliella mucimassa]|uniref:Flagellar motor switch protein FliG n=1 Tax=Aeoliella mucimassa TaxID=2527972 RepID=A0A518ATX9_9BACT|nr:flagellar motor switch protein FliG [Aeoliella mucimassa]QDU58155.1 Flagellar motor switch protein FliG [Aeoliella mucimassa]